MRFAPLLLCLVLVGCDSDGGDPPTSPSFEGEFASRMKDPANGYGEDNVYKLVVTVSKEGEALAGQCEVYWQFITLMQPAPAPEFIGAAQLNGTQRGGRVEFRCPFDEFSYNDLRFEGEHVALREDAVVFEGNALGGFPGRRGPLYNPAFDTLTKQAGD